MSAGFSTGVSRTCSACRSGIGTGMGSPVVEPLKERGYCAGGSEWILC